MPPFEDRIRELADEAHLRCRKNEDGIYEIVLRGERGAIYQHSTWKGEDTLLAAHIETTHAFQRLKAVQKKCPAATLHVAAEDAVIILHPVKGWKTFAKAVGAKTIRQLSPQEREELIERGRQFQTQVGVQVASLDHSATFPTKTVQTGG